MRRRVLVLDASERAALAFIRSLGKRGVEVVAADHSRLTTGLLSRYAKKRLIYPSPEESWSRFVKFLKKELSKNTYDMLMPISEFTTTIVSYHKDELDGYTIVATPDYETYLKAYDKAETVKCARGYGIPHPKTYFVEDFQEVGEIAKDLSYPVVIKPRRKTYWYQDEAKVVKITERNYAHNPKDLVEKYDVLLSQHSELLDLGLLPILQEYISGETVGVGVLISDGEPKALFMHKRLTEYPTSGGASTLRESTFHKDALKVGVDVVKALGWRGIAMAELKVDARDQTPKVIEVNGRPWGSLPLAITAGVDFPYLLYTLVVEGDVQPVTRYLLGVKQTWLIPGHLLWLFETLRKGGSKLRTIAYFLKSFPWRDDVVSFRDPMPTVGALKVTAQLVLDVISGKRKITGERW